MPVGTNVWARRVAGVSPRWVRAAVGPHGCRCVQFTHLHACPGLAGQAQLHSPDVALLSQRSPPALKYDEKVFVLLEESVGTFQAVTFSVCLAYF